MELNSNKFLFDLLFLSSLITKEIEDNFVVGTIELYLGGIDLL